MATVEERRDALRKLLLELLQSTTDAPELEKTIRMAYNELSLVAEPRDP